MSFEFNLIFVLTAAIGILTPRRAEESTGEPGWAHLPNKPNSLPWQGWTYQTCAQHILKYRILHNPRLSMPKNAKHVGNAFLKLLVKVGLFKSQSACISNFLLLIEAFNQKVHWRKIVRNTHFHEDFLISFWFLVYESHRMVQN